MNNYISEIVISNFQSHQETIVELSSGVNALIGDTDSGKSAIFRALIWFFTNRPTGDEFRSYWGGDTEVAICLAPEDLWLGRVKSDSKNYYWIGEDNQDNRLQGFGNGSPPQKILDILNLGDVNFQAQMTLPFLLSMTSGKAGKFYNEAADLDIIDRSITNVNSMLKKERAQLVSAESDQKRLTEKLEGFEWIDEADIQLNMLENKANKISELDNYIDRLDKLADDVEKLEGSIKKAAPILEAEPELKRLSILDGNIAVLEAEKKRLDYLLDDIDKIEHDIEIDKEIFSAEDDIEKLISLKADIDDRTKTQIDLIVSVEGINSLERDIEEGKNALNELEDEFHELMPDECPLCGK